jgi:glycosyltransferase involved in cell wall biosynthesis
LRLGIDAWGISGDQFATGMGQYTYHLLEALPRFDQEVTVIAYAGPGERRPDWLPDQVGWRPIGRRLPGKLSALHSRVMALPTAVSEDRLDLFHAPSVHARPLFPPVPRLDCPVVVTLHDLIPLTYYRPSTMPRRQQVFYRWNLHRAATSARLITVSEQSRWEIMSRLGVPPQRVTAIHNGVDFAPNFSPSVLARWQVERPYILYAGSYEPRKNLLGALRAYRRVVAEGLPHNFVAVVERASGYQPELANALDAMGLGSRVQLLHSLPEADLRALYTHAEALFFPSLAEGFGFPPVQAAAVGLAAVISDIPSLREVMGPAALYVNPGDDRAMAEGLASVLSDAALRARLIADGRERARLFTREACVRGHSALYRDVLAGRLAFQPPEAEKRRAQRAGQGAEG